VEGVGRGASCTAASYVGHGEEQEGGGAKSRGQRPARARPKGAVPWWAALLLPPPPGGPARWEPVAGSAAAALLMEVFFTP
jgi:hypothetical protein